MEQEMDNQKYIQGSQWAKWDLHVHTPKSIVQNYGGDTPEVWEKFITDLEELPEEYKVIGINDYIFIDGYKKVLEFKEAGRLKNIDLILPVIELRLDKFASLGDEAWKKVNLHVIFSPEHTPEIIEAQFLSAVQHSISISPDCDGVDFNGVATRENLESLGKQIKDTANVEVNGTDLKVGFSNLCFDYKEVLNITTGFFKDTCLIAVGKSEWDTMRWTGSAAVKKNIINKADFSFTALSSSDLYEKHVQALRDQQVRDLLLDCSDAHHFSDSSDKDRIGNSFTWIKANTTFDGLKLVAQDSERIFVGTTPTILKRVAENKTKFIKSLSVARVEGKASDETWFEDFQLPLNPGMVTIIGNKGNGKSALADTIGLLGNTPNHKFFSFLNTKKFRKKRPYNKAECFEGVLEWKDSSLSSMQLHLNPDNESKEKVKYIPQGFLEKLCNEDVGDFEQELRKVIYSHLPESDRLGKSSIEELIEYKTEYINGLIEGAKSKLRKTNQIIAGLEAKQTEEYRNSIIESLNEKQKELAALPEPKEAEQPDDPEVISKNKKTSEEIEKLRAELKKVDDDVEAKEAALKTLKIDNSELVKAKEELKTLQNSVDASVELVTTILKKNSIDIGKVLSFKFDFGEIDELISKKTEEIDNLNELLNNSSNTEGLRTRKIRLESELKKKQNELDAVSKAYQTYLDQLKHWQNKKKAIIGNAEAKGTIKFFEAKINYIDSQLQSDIQVQMASRQALVRELFQAKESIVDLYKSLFKPVSDFIKNYGDILEDYSIRLDVGYRIKGLSEKFFDHINLGAKGSFIGNTTGMERLKSIIEEHDLDTEDGVVGFLDEVTNSLTHDLRDGFDNEKREITKQLKKGYTVTDVYNFLFGLEYLEPEYQLNLGDKHISELSPGERGALLLIFYLTLDQSDIPLVIDQPEENLDNQSVFKILVKFITKAKENRQLIIITHNPNIAVTCGSEQVVFVSIDKSNKNKVGYLSGALEDRVINDAVIDILEGTFPALNIRTNAYKVIKRN